MKDSTHSTATRKQIKGPLIVVAIVTAIDLVQLVLGSVLLVTSLEGDEK